MRHIAITALGLVLALSACSSSEPGTTISINATTNDGNMAANVDKAGTLSLDTPIFKGELKLPKMKLDASDFDMNGVHLYPGSKITAMNINANGDGDGKKDDVVRVGFESPATPDVVRDWFKTRLNDAGFNVSATGTGLKGTTDEGKPFEMTLTPSDNGQSRGEIRLTG